MNRPYAEILMYSGMCHLDPRTELTDEQANVVRAKFAQLTEPFSGKRYYGTGVLSSTSYMVCLPESRTIYVQDNGYVYMIGEVYNPDDTGLQDTAGLHHYLKELLMPALIKHGEDMQKEWDAYNEKMFGISKEEKV